MKDIFDNEFEIGSIVIYNMSGDLAVGKIVDIKKFHRTTYQGLWDYTYKIQLMKPVRGLQVGHISSVRNKGGMIVVAQGFMQ